MAIRASISYASLQASVSSAKPAASITYELASATGIWTDPDSKNRFVRDELPLSDVRFNFVEKNLADTTVMQEVPAWHLTKPATPEILSVADVFTKVVAYNRSFTDAFTLDDLSQIDKDFYGNKGNIFAFTDIIGLTHEKSLVDDYTVGDIVENLVSKFLVDVYTFDDEHYAEVIKGLADDTVLADFRVTKLEKALVDSVNIPDEYTAAFSLPKAETLTLAENFAKVVSYSRAFTDAFTLDDLSQIDKDFYGNKGNIFAFTDVIGLTHNKVFTDSYTVGDVVSVVNTFKREFTDSVVPGDTSYLDISKISDDDFVFTDSQAKASSKVTTDLFTFSDTPSVGPHLSKSDDFSLSEMYLTAITKHVTDAFVLDDATQVNKDYSGNKGNLVAFTDVLSRTVTFNRAFADNQTLIDVAAKGFSKTFIDTINVYDDLGVTSGLNTNALNTKALNGKGNAPIGASSTTIGVSPNRYELLGFADLLAQNFTKGATEALSLYDTTSMHIRMDKGELLPLADVMSSDVSKAANDLCTVSDSANVATEKTFSDACNIHDILATTISKSITDAFTLDDSALVNKDFYGNKGNIVGIDDVVTVTRVARRLLNGASLNRTQIN